MGTFTTQHGEYFLEPLMKAEEGEEYDEEHNKPHLVYRQDRKRREGPASEPTQPCSASGNRPTTVWFCSYIILYNHSLIVTVIVTGVPLTLSPSMTCSDLQLCATAVITVLNANSTQSRSLAAGLPRRFEP